MRKCRGLFWSVALCALGCGGANSTVESTGTLLADAGVSDAAPLDAALVVSAADGRRVQLNDVSILFPLPTTTADLTLLVAASASGARGTLLPSALYDAVGHIAAGGPNNGPGGGGGGNGTAAYTDLRVVAMRIDPCFAVTSPPADGTGCVAQLRLVMQQVTSNGGGATAADSALHVFYELTRADLLALSQAIVALRIANSTGARLGALAPHPIIAQQGLSGTMATGLRALILQYAGASNLTRVTEMNGHGQNFWQFLGYDVSDAAAATITPMVIPTLPASATSQRFNKNGGPGGGIAGTFVPATTDTDADFSVLTTNNADTAGTTALDAIARVDNPTLNTPNTIDCASCHMATPAALIVERPLHLVEATDSFAFAADGTDVLASELTPTFTGAAASTCTRSVISGTVPASINAS